MIRITTILALLMFTSCCDDDLVVGECPCLDAVQEPVFKACEPTPIFQEYWQCGIDSLLKQVYRTITYPPEARMDSIEGRIVVAFEIYTDGSLGNFQTVHDTLGYGLADEVLMAAQTLAVPGFCPALVNCTPVVDTFYLPVSFQLN